MEESSIAQTPTWVVAVVCLAIVSVSVVTERLLYYLGKAFKRKKQKTLYSALERLKEELMLLGFISFVLSLSQGFIVGICIPENAAHWMLPCEKENHRHAEEAVKLCKKKDEVPLLSLEALHQLHIFIFVLGLVHVVFCVTTMLLGGAKITKWKKWETGIRSEKEPKSREIEATPGHNHQIEFVSERTKWFWMRLAVESWIIAFLKQFHDSVSKSDYKALRSAFGLRHYPKHQDFNFHTYMVRALQYDFRTIVGISWYLWLFVILFLFLNINGWHTYFWLAFLPLFLLLVVGTKLEHIIIQLAREAVVPPSRELFWFRRPEIVFRLIHFILFQNSFEIGFFLWVLLTYGFDSCIMEKKAYAISRLVIGVIIELICSYITLPLYAIVTHMDGDIKLQGLGLGLFEEVADWAKAAAKMDRSGLGLLNAPTRKNPGGGAVAGDGATEVEVTRARSDDRNALARTPHLDEIVSVDGGGGEGQGRQATRRAGMLA